MKTLLDRTNERDHHPWCNRHNKPRPGCTLCAEYYEKYPICVNMEQKYFPFKGPPSSEALVKRKKLAKKKRVPENA